MKYLSFILTNGVDLSTAPCFMEDKCHDRTFQIADNQEQNEDDCDKECCSPFFTCKTCTGFVVTLLHFSIPHVVKQPEMKISRIIASPVSDFPFLFGIPHSLCNMWCFQHSLLLAVHSTAIIHLIIIFQ